MDATYRVKNSAGVTVGFIVDEQFMNKALLKENIARISNLTQCRNGVIRAATTLPIAQYADIITKHNYTEIVKKNPFERDIAIELKKWKQSNYTSILQVNGARQTGKTTEILKFAYGNYETVIYVNLVRDDYNFANCMKQNRVSIELAHYCERANLPLQTAAITRCYIHFIIADIRRC